MRRISYDRRCELWKTTCGCVELRGHVARGFLDRLLGLMGQRKVPADALMLFGRCRSVHTMHMRVPIDLVWLAKPDLDGSMRVVGVRRAVRPWRAELAPEGAWGVAELAEGSAPEWAPGARLRVR